MAVSSDEEGPSVGLGQAVPDLDALLARVRAGAALAGSHLHGEHHWRSVATVARRLLDEGEPGDPAVVFLFALLHDCRRVDEGADRLHGRRAAAFTTELDETELGLARWQRSMLVVAIGEHTGGRADGRETAAVCFDADRLLLGRVGITPDPARLATSSARRQDVRDWADELEDVADWGELFVEFTIARDRG